MRYPCLVNKMYCKTPVVVTIKQEGIDKYGEPLANTVITANCNYQDKAWTVLTAEKKQIKIGGVALFPGDIAPDLPTISGGYITVYGVIRIIHQGRKCRNPDGTVNYTQIEVI